MFKKIFLLASFLLPVMVSADALVLFKPPVNAFIYNYSFALRPEDAQPTGTMNASRIDSIVWQIQMNTVLSNPTMPLWQQRGSCHIVVYAHNYNVFRVINGFGGLLFTI